MKKPGLKQKRKIESMCSFFTEKGQNEQLFFFIDLKSSISYSSHSTYIYI